MCGRFFVAMDDPEILEILKEIELENRRQRLDLPLLKPEKSFLKTIQQCGLRLREKRHDTNKCAGGSLHATKRAC